MPEQVLNILIFVVIGGLLCFGAVVYALIGEFWIQAVLAGASIAPSDILRMRLRGTDAKAVVKAIITAKQGGVSISCTEMECAHLQGVDLRKVTLAAIEAKKQGLEISFQELVDAELSDQLAETLSA